MVVLDLCLRLVAKTSREDALRYSYWAVFVATYVAGQLSVALECRPFHLYWQIYPDPGACVKGNAWLITYEVGNLITDAMLVIMPFPVLFAVKTRWQKKVQLCSLFSIGFFLIAVTLVRIIQGIPNARVQSTRTFWGSIETLFATLVAQAPTLYTLLRRTTSQNSYQQAGDSYRLASSGYQTTDRSKPRRVPNDRDIELGGVGADGGDKSYSVRAFSGRNDKSNPASADDENESTKGILVTVDIAKVDTDV
ncbi:COPII coat GTPase [Exophiala xenobiotica]|nr:COPII coat GTPase [Exophiala xenobiotica]